MSTAETARSPAGMSLDRSLACFGVCAVLGGAAELAVVTDADTAPLWVAWTFVVVGWIYIGAGLLAWYRRPSNGLGAVMVVGGVTWLLSDLTSTDSRVLIAAGTVIATVPLAVVIHLVLAFPSGRLTSPASRVTVSAVYVVSVVLQAPMYLFTAQPAPYDLLVAADRPGLARAGHWAQTIAGALVVLATGAILVQRLRSATPAQRRVLAPLYGYGVLAVLAIPLLPNVIEPLFHLPQVAVGGLQVAVLAGIPVAFVIGVLRGGFARTGEVIELGALLGELGAGHRPALRDALARTLGDPSLRLAYWVPGRDSFVDNAGSDVTLPSSPTDRAVVEVDVEGRRVGAIEYDSRLIAEPALVHTAGRIVAIAVDRERLTAELRASEEALLRSRERIIEAGDRERRHIARNLHDGLQVRLVVLAIEAQELADDDRSAHGREAATALRLGIDDAAAVLRDLVHAVLPAALIERGLSAAAEDLVDRMPVPTKLEVSGLHGQLSRAVESTAYFVMAEGLTNALKHGKATSLSVQLSRAQGQLRVEVADNGVGGAHTGGSGLRGLADRLDVLGGRLHVDSRTGVGTRLVADLPCG